MDAGSVVSAAAWALCQAVAEATNGLPAVLGLAVAMLSMLVTFSLAVATLLLPPRPAFVRDLVDLVFRGRLPTLSTSEPRREASPRCS